MRKFIFVYLTLMLFSIKTQCQWGSSHINSNYYIESVWFLDQDTGFIVNGDYGINGIICKTTNGGKNWTVVSSETYLGLQDISFINKKVGFAIGTIIQSDYIYGTILKTINGGNSWSRIWTGNITSPGISSLERLFFTDSLNGYITSSSKKILKTTDGGNTWEIKSLTNEGTKIFFLNKDTGFIASNSYFQRTMDAGQTWTSNYFSGAKDIFFLNEKIGFSVQSYDIRKTTDGGLTWTTKYSASSDDFQTVKFINDSVGYAFANMGYVYKTLDGGEHWFIQDNPTNDRIHKVFFIDSCIGYAVGTGGTLLYTENGGLVKPKIELQPSLTICEGDTCTLNVNNVVDYHKYFWSNGINQKTLKTAKSGVYFVKVENSLGCSAFSDTSQIVVKEIPIVKLSMDDSKIIVQTKDSNNSYDWYVDDNFLFTGYDSSFIVQINGTYKVVVTNSFGCKGYSDTIVVSNNGIKETRELEIEIFPNPTDNLVNIKSIKPIIINLYDIKGNLLKEINSCLSCSLNLSEGIYLLEIIGENNKIIKRIIVK